MLPAFVTSVIACCVTHLYVQNSHQHLAVGFQKFLHRLKAYSR